MHKRKNGTILELEVENQRNSFVVDECSIITSIKYCYNNNPLGVGSVFCRSGTTFRKTLLKTRNIYCTLHICQLLLLPPGLLTKNSKYVIEASISVDGGYAIVSSL